MNTQCGNCCDIKQKFRESNAFAKEIARVDLTEYLFRETKFFAFPLCSGAGESYVL